MASPLNHRFAQHYPYIVPLPSPVPWRKTLLRILGIALLSAALLVLGATLTGGLVLWLVR
jgi:hypothetical protein